jgi:hypothetical protein
LTYPKPVYLGKFSPIPGGDIVDLYVDIAADLATGETLSTATFTVTDASGTTVAGVGGAPTESDTRTDFRLTAPATPGGYTLTLVSTISDGQKLTHTADLRVL